MVALLHGTLVDTGCLTTYTCAVPTSSIYDVVVVSCSVPSVPRTVGETGTMACLGKPSYGRLLRRSQCTELRPEQIVTTKSEDPDDLGTTQPMRKDETSLTRERSELSKTGFRRKLMNDQVGGISETVQVGHLSPPRAIGFSMTTQQMLDALEEPVQKFPKYPERAESSIAGDLERQEVEAVRVGLLSDPPNLTAIAVSFPLLATRMSVFGVSPLSSGTHSCSPVSSTSLRLDCTPRRLLGRAVGGRPQGNRRPPSLSWPSTLDFTGWNVHEPPPHLSQHVCTPVDSVSDVDRPWGAKTPFSFSIGHTRHHTHTTTQRTCPGSMRLRFVPQLSHS